MDITDFMESYDEDNSYDYKMFIYGNYTYRDNLEADSLVVVLRNVIPFLSKRYNIHFTLMTPQVINSLSFPNVNQVIYALPTYCNTMRTHFDATRFLEMIDWKRQDFDIIYSHVPEHTSQISNVVFNNTHLQPKMIGYSHWFEVPQNAPYEKTMLPASLHGMLETEEFGVNSDWLKQLVLSEAEKYIASPLIQQLETIIQPHYLGVDEIRTRSTKIEPRSVIFNHRDSGYTGWSWFVEAMDKLWEKRQDFTVYTTLTKIDKPWNQRIDAPTRSEYMNRLHRMQFGVSCFEKYSAWSISTTDGLSLGVPYLLPNHLCYPEMVSDNYPFMYNGRDEFLTMFEYMLDAENLVKSEKMIKNISKQMVWESRIANWFDGWDKVFDLKTLKEPTRKYTEIYEMIKKSRYLTKKDIMGKLGWGVQIKWSPYRNMLRLEENIKLTKDGYEYTG